MAVKIGGHSIELSNIDKIIFPQDKIAKGEIIDYYYRVAKIMVPHMKGRLISMQRFPNGIDKEGFYQKEAGSYFPSWIPTKAVKKEEGDGQVNYVICNNTATLVYLANQLCLTPHLWLSKSDKLHYPDRMIFDLDPSGKDFSYVLDAAKILKEILEGHKLVPFVMTTGSRGLHVVVPLKRTKKFSAVRSFARHIASEMAKDDSKRFTIEVRKEKRHGRVFIDYLRNGFGATGVAPYAIRPKKGAPIATPLEWEQVKKGLSPQQYTIKNIFKRISQHADPWKQMNKYARSIKKID